MDIFAVIAESPIVTSSLPFAAVYAVERLLPLVSDNANKRAVRLAKAKKQQQG